jgi:hypothetical protein
VSGDGGALECAWSREVDSRQTTPSVRLWIDVDPSAGDWNECEIALQQRAPGQWVGSFSVPSDAPLRFMFRMGLIAAGDGEWSLTLRDRRRCRVLHQDGDTLALAKTWVVGTCSLFTSLAPTARPAFGARPLHEPRPITAATAEPKQTRALPNVVQLDRYR